MIDYANTKLIKWKLSQPSPGFSGKSGAMTAIFPPLGWQTIPFPDLLFPEEAYRGPGVWPMARWEAQMAKEGHSYVMLSTQEDETAKFFYGILGYQPIGAFLPLELEARVLLYEKSVPLR